MKKIIIKIMLIVLPLMAAVLATTGDSVKIVDVATQEMTVASYFEVLPEGTIQMFPHIAGICAVLSVLLGGMFLSTKKAHFLNGSRWSAFVGAVMAVMPLAFRDQTLMLPNVGVPILLMAQFFLATYGKKMDLRSDKEKNGPRLDRH